MAVLVGLGQRRCVVLPAEGVRPDVLPWSADSLRRTMSPRVGRPQKMAYYLGMPLPGKRAVWLPLIVIGLSALLTSIICGCGGGSHVSRVVGPLSSGNGIHASPTRGFGICAPGGRPSAFGFDLFTNYGHSMIILSRVVLLHPRNEHLVGSFAIPGDGILGAVRWPPSSQPTWKDRRPVHGFRLAAGKSFNMVLGIAAIAEDRRATSQGELIYYHDSSGRFVAKSYSAYTIAADNKPCS